MCDEEREDETDGVTCRSNFFSPYSKNLARDDCHEEFQRPTSQLGWDSIALMFARSFFATSAIRSNAASFVRRMSNNPVLETMPAPGTPFHLAFPVHNLETAKEFYGGVLGLAEVNPKLVCT